MSLSKLGVRWAVCVCGCVKPLDVYRMRRKGFYGKLKTQTNFIVCFPFKIGIFTILYLKFHTYCRLSGKENVLFGFGYVELAVCLVVCLFVCLFNSFKLIELELYDRVFSRANSFGMFFKDN